MKRIIFLAMAAALLTGCDPRGNVNEKAYLRAAAVEDDRVTLAFFSEDDGVITVPLGDLKKARSAGELALGKEIFTGHTELVLVGSEDKEKALEHILKEWRVSPSCIAAEPSGSGEEILKKRKPQQLTGIIETAQKQDLAADCRLIAVLGRLLDGNDPEMPLLSVYGLEGG